MTIVIFEGADNLGKSTIINSIAQRYVNDRDILFMHASAPVLKPGEDPKEVQERTFRQMFAKCNYMSNLEHTLETSRKNIVFMDRSQYGEYVYGQLYRNQNPDDILKMFSNIRVYSSINIIVVHLEASADFVISHDDHKSFTSDYDAEKRKASVQKELDLFNECFEKANPANYIKVNVEGEQNNYRNLDDICDEILNRIKELNIEL